jgi:hypothetical protein
LRVRRRESSRQKAPRALLQLSAIAASPRDVARLLKILAIIVGLALAVVAGVFGAVIVALILIAAAVFSLFGKGKVNVTMK